MTNTTNVNVWHQITATWNSSGVWLYFDGRFINRTLITGPTTFGGAVGQEFQLMRRATADGEFNMDEFGIWNRTLKPFEVVDLYDEGDYIGFEIESFSVNTTLVSPINFFNSSTSNVIFNASGTSKEDTIINISIYHNLTGVWHLNISNTSLNNNNFSLFEINFSDGTGVWNALICDNSGEECRFAFANRTLTVDTTAPIINVTAPLPIINYSRAGDNLTLSWEIFDFSLNTCWFNYNSTNTTIPCSPTTYSFELEEEKQNLTFYANDSAGRVGSDFAEWIYRIFQTDLVFNENVIEGSQQTFELFVNASEVITNSILIYNKTSHTTNLLTLGGDAYKISSTIQIPNFGFNSNVSFLFNITLTGGDTISTAESNQSVSVLNMGNCSVFNQTLFNLTLFDERTLEDINGTIEIDLEILNELDSSLLSSVSTVFDNVHQADVCSDINITGGGLLYNLELRYFSSPDNGSTFNYVPEFYHIQKADVSGLPQIIPLFDLNVNESTEFTIFYRDNDYIAREDVLLQIQRKYVDEGIFRVIEIPITSSQGSAVGHFDLNNYKYKITVTKDGVVLNQFSNPSIRCESELSGICEITLKGLAETPTADFVSETEDFFYTADQTNDSVIIDYSVPSGEAKLVTISMIQNSPFADPQIICNQSILSSAGSLECDVNPTIGDSSVTINIVSDSEQKANLVAIFQEDLQTSFLLNNYFIAAMLLITLILMFITSTKMMIGSAIFGLVFLGMVFLLKASSMTLIVGAISWLLLAVIIILFKLNKKEEQ